MIQPQIQQQQVVSGLGIGKHAMIRPATTQSMRLDTFGAINNELSGSFHTSEFSFSHARSASASSEESKRPALKAEHKSQVDKFFGNNRGNDGQGGGGMGGMGY